MTTKGQIEIICKYCGATNWADVWDTFHPHTFQPIEGWETIHFVCWKCRVESTDGEPIKYNRKYR